MTMRFLLSRFSRSLVGASLLALAISTAQAATRELDLPAYLGRPGALVPVPLELNNASGLAGITIRLNFDDALLSVEAIEPGALGSSFTLQQDVAGGVLTLLFTRTENLISGAGRLAAIHFRLNAGAPDGSFGDLVVGEFSLSDASGVIDPVANGDTLTVTNGRITVSAYDRIDNDHDWLPDTWESAHGLSLLQDDSRSDSDGDGIPNLLEYAFGLDPALADTSPQLAALLSKDGIDFLSLSFPKLRSANSGLIYSVQESPGLDSDWMTVNLATNTAATLDHGDGTETVTVRGNLPLSGPGSTPRVFMRVQISPDPEATP